ncbi:plasmid maintenance system killer [Candidatus Peregrinibacteria bacterium CG11_big_fil_rev_8_21_14_0_20_46_8]|nr:MAG: plasmid maintenance system killer [Candidatus Peregrinibacteria bacterium CG11_big_fil_rev_8_21_14_0_20_46_8]
MIKHFKCRETEKIFHTIGSQKFPDNIQKRALIKLTALHACTSINDLRIPPSNHLEQLRGNRRGQHSIRINEQWRICFIWLNNNAYEVEIVDYH